MTNPIRIALPFVALLFVACGGNEGTGEMGGDGGQVGDGGPETIDHAPIVAPEDTWTWVDFPDSKCGSGTATGIAINPHAGATNLLIYFEGGGSCHDATTCWGPSPTAANVAGYDVTVFSTAKQRAYPILDRTTVGNPFANLNMVYIPYCTGDFHAGTVEVDMQVNGTTKPTYFWGARDLALFLARLAPTFPQATHVWSTGASAGGFGAFLTYAQVTQAFPVRVDMIDDSGPAIFAKGGTSNASAFATYGLPKPTGCNPCTAFSDILAADRKLQPGSKFGFLSFSQDTVISKDFGYTLIEYPTVMTDFSASLSADGGSATYLFGNEASHMVQSDRANADAYLPWMTKMVNDDPTWGDLKFP